MPLPAVALTWLAPKASDPDAPALQVLDAILTAGKSSRLYDSLVYDKQIAAQVFSSADLRAATRVLLRRRDRRRRATRRTRSKRR